MGDEWDEFAPTKRHGWPGFPPTLVGGLKVLGLVYGLVLGAALLMGVLAQVPSRCPGTPIHVACQNNLRIIAFALQNYQRDYGCLPPAIVTDGRGKPMHSWRVLILPYLDQQVTYDAYNFQEPWNSPSNRRLIEAMPVYYACPAEGTQIRAKFQTSYFAIVGPGLAFPGPNQSVSLEAIPDDTARTLLVVESRSLPVVWTEPRDLDLSRMSLRVNDLACPSLSSRHAEGPNVVWACRHVSSLSETTPPETIRALLTIDGEETISGP